MTATMEPTDAAEAPLKTGRLYAAGWWLSRVLFNTIWRRRTFGLDNVPTTGPLIVAPNHMSFVDPPLVGSALPRPLYYMAKEELFQMPVLGWVISQTNAFPVRRSVHDVAAFKAARRILRAGGAVVMFPEGRRQKAPVLGAPRPGLGLLAVSTGTAVLPTYVHNTHRVLRFPRLSVTFGRPLKPEPEEDPRRFVERVMDAIRALKEAHHD
jgi:1-acyl-sn-glycerol-3-phosphate acyltransferase